MSFPKLPARAAYLTLSNPSRRNALSRSVLHDLKSQLEKYNTDETGEKCLLLPSWLGNRGTRQPFNSDFTSTSPNAARYNWLSSPEEWNKRRGHLPKVLVLRSEGPVFCSGHDLAELASLPPEEVEETFKLCATVMKLVAQCPIPVVCAVQGLATAAGFQLAMATDYPIAMAGTKFQLPGISIGVPCTSPSVQVSRRVPSALVHRMLLTGEPVRADQLHGAVDVVPVPEHAESTDTTKAAFEQRVEEVVQRLVGVPSQPQALGKFAYWAQLEMPLWRATRIAGQLMQKHTANEDGREGIAAFLEKRSPSWIT